jgi:hypothetical protein
MIPFNLIASFDESGDLVMGIPFGGKAAEAVAAIKDAADKTSAFVKFAIGLALGALCLAAVALWKVAKTS